MVQLTVPPIACLYYLGYFLSMLDLQRIPMSRVLRAYELTLYQADDLIQALCPHAVFPLGLWQRAYDHFWKDYARAAAMRQRAECLILPDVEMEPGKRFFTDLCGFDVMAFFRKLSLLRWLSDDMKVTQPSL